MTATTVEPSPRRAERRRARPVLWRPMLLIITAGIVVRVWQLDAVGFNSDEAVYAGQAASLAGDGTLSMLFPVFRAHPLLFQTTLSLVFLGGVSDLAARLVSVAFGVATIVLVQRLGTRLYGRDVGLLAAALLALMPYHVVVTRQVLLDGPLTFFVVLVFYFLTRYCLERSARWLHATAAASGLAVLTKEIAAIMVIAVAVFFLLRREFHLPPRTVLVSVGVLVAIVSLYPLSLLIAGRSSTGRNYLLWQLFRPANHPPTFYAETVAPAIGLAVLLLAFGGLALLRRQAGWRESLLLCWTLVPLVFFQVWPVKGYQYFLVFAPAITLLAARTLMRTAIPWRHLRGAVIAIVLLTVAAPSAFAVQPPSSPTFIAGSGGVPAGREAGAWIDANLPQHSNLMTIGPSMANIVRFYGHRRAYALSVSANPLRRNPSYEPIDNPDRQLRERRLQYVVWDAYSAARAPFYSTRLMNYVRKYNGIAVHTETLDVDGKATAVIVVYEVRP